MTQREQDYCFCTLALGSRYRLMARELAGDLVKYAPGTPLVVFTDHPDEFIPQTNVKAFKHVQQSTLRCVNDKRFLLQKALSMYRVAIHIDADTRIFAAVPNQVEWPPGMTARTENLLKHLQKNCPQYIDTLKTVASKLDISDSTLENAEWIGESIYVIARDGGKEKEFLSLWGAIANYMELQDMHPNDGNLMGLAAAKVGWKVNSNGWKELSQIRKHLDASFNRPPQTFRESLIQRLGYHYRLNKARLRALKDFNFYYR